MSDQITPDMDARNNQKPIFQMVKYCASIMCYFNENNNVITVIKRSGGVMLGL